MTGTPPPREGIRRVVVVIPSAFTIGNLFFGFWSIILAFNGNFKQAGWFIVYAGILELTEPGRTAADERLRASDGTIRWHRPPQAGPGSSSRSPGSPPPTPG